MIVVGIGYFICSTYAQLIKNAGGTIELTEGIHLNGVHGKGGFVGPGDVVMPADGIIFGEILSIPLQMRLQKKFTNLEVH